VPSDERLAALALQWLPDEATRQAVLVRNPQRLYWGGGAD
jgi:predicted TIM-barrel fold metal-dependent hydrolase